MFNYLSESRRHCGTNLKRIQQQQQHQNFNSLSSTNFEKSL